MEVKRPQACRPPLFLGADPGQFLVETLHRGSFALDMPGAMLSKSRAEAEQRRPIPARQVGPADGNPGSQPRLTA